MILLVAAVGGNRLWMNIRPDDPLPPGFVQYSPAALQAAFASGEPVLVDVYASWCPTCAAQHKVLSKIFQDPRYQGVKGVRVDFEGDPDFVRPHNVYTQSTMIMFRDGREVSRTIGLTSEASIRRQLDAALADQAVLTP